MTRLIPSFLLILSIASCGGGGSANSNGSSESSTDVSGKAIDGYISGARVFLDLNFNGLRDVNEPSTVSVAEGDFNFGLTDSEPDCASYVPIVVDVPSGANLW